MRSNTLDTTSIAVNGDPTLRTLRSNSALIGNGKADKQEFNQDLAVSKYLGESILTLAIRRSMKKSHSISVDKADSGTCSLPVQLPRSSDSLPGKCDMILPGLDIRSAERRRTALPKMFQDYDLC